MRESRGELPSGSRRCSAVLAGHDDVAGFGDQVPRRVGQRPERAVDRSPAIPQHVLAAYVGPDRKSTRLNSSHDQISYAVFCLKKKKKQQYNFEKQKTKKK